MSSICEGLELVYLSTLYLDKKANTLLDCS